MKGCLDTRTPTVILQCSSYPLHAGIIGIIRSLGRIGVPIHLVGQARGPATRSRYIGTTALCPGALSPDQILELLDSLPLSRPAVLIPVDDTGALLINEHAAHLRQRFLFPNQPTNLPQSLADKRKLSEMAKCAGVAMPHSCCPASVTEVETFLRAATFPVVVKAGDPVLLKATSARSVQIAKNAQELWDQVRQLCVAAEFNVVLQEYIPGGPDRSWMINAYYNSESRPLFAATGRKARQWPPYTGFTTLGECTANEELVDTTHRFMARLGYCGIVDMGYRYDERDGLYKLLDVNPRIGATFRLFTATNGLDAVRALYLDLTGQVVPEAHVREGRRWFVENYDVCSSWRYHRDGILTAIQYIKAFKGLEESAWFDRHDLAPFVAMLSSSAARAPSLRRPHTRGTTRTPARLAPQYPTLGTLGQPNNVYRAQQKINAHFDMHATYWRDLYNTADLDGLIYQERQERALALLDQAGLGPAAKILEVGSGAGHAALQLAARGLHVHATDASPSMLAMLKGYASTTGARTLRCSEVDVHTLSATLSEQYDAVLALGVFPWLHSPPVAIREISKVLRPGGCLIASIDNRLRLNYLVDPLFNPSMAPIRRTVRGALQHVGIDVTAGSSPQANLMLPREFDYLLAQEGLLPLCRQTVGFGPFTVGGRPIFSERTARYLHNSLQAKANRQHPMLRLRGAHYLVSARKDIQNTK